MGLRPAALSRLLSWELTELGERNAVSTSGALEALWKKAEALGLCSFMYVEAVPKDGAGVLTESFTHEDRVATSFLVSFRLLNEADEDPFAVNFFKPDVIVPKARAFGHSAK